jgi:hypothetical protein
MDAVSKNWWIPIHESIYKHTHKNESLPLPIGGRSRRNEDIQLDAKKTTSREVQRRHAAAAAFHAAVAQYCIHCKRRRCCPRNPRSVAARVKIMFYHYYYSSMYSS